MTISENEDITIYHLAQIKWDMFHMEFSPSFKYKNTNHDTIRSAWEFA